MSSTLPNTPNTSSPAALHFNRGSFATSAVVSRSKWVRPRRFGWLWVWLLLVLPGCYSASRSDLDYSYEVYQTIQIPELSDQELLQFKSVFWEPDDTASLRKMVTGDHIADGRTVMEIGTGMGLVSLACLAGGATKVVATDINPAAVANAKYNAAMLDLDTDFEVRLVRPEQPGAFSVIRDDERFDLIVSNPPWEDGTVDQPADHAFYDPGFALMDSLLAGLPKHLNPGGRCLLAYGHKPAITRLLSKAESLGYQVKVLDDRKLDDLPNDFLPGMLVEVRLGRGQIPKVDSGQALEKSSDPSAADSQPNDGD
ncbi:50S ribosomal protein L11 methyltransferase [Roseiconus nitratireducens]|nr:50S ribosomal protein L11 methyltransferase [Roseiconus nitratireducens]